MKSIRKGIFIVFITFGLLLQSTMGYASEIDNHQLIFPHHMLAVDSFQGEFTQEILASLESIPAAEALSILNVLRGSNGNLMLDRPANRMEGATMLVRLLGAEQDALMVDYSHPFTDVDDWASPYVGYLYQNELTNGIGNNLYGSTMPVNEKAYLTFLLRALGYSDKDGQDFTWDTVEQTAIQTGLLLPGETMSEDAPFMRQRLSELSWRAMFLNHKLHNQSLLVYLQSQGMISYANVERLLKGENAPLLDQWFARLSQFEQGFSGHYEKIEILLNETLASNDVQKHLGIILEHAQRNTGVFITGYSSEVWQEGEEHKLTLYPRYVNTLEEDYQLFYWIENIYDMIFLPDMTDYDKVKAAHDFLIMALEYDTSTPIPDSSYHAYGALATGKAVCSAYAELMLLLLDQAGVPCRIVTGVGKGEDHAWNMVYINGEPYHVDVTWDDPVNDMAQNMLRYDYFNLTDEEMKKEHTWMMDDYLACTATDENYFVKENMVVTSVAGLKKAVGEAVQNRENNCMFRLQGFDIASLDINTMINEISAEAGDALSAYMVSWNEFMQVIVFDHFEYSR